MDIILNEIEVRVLGSLMEKALSTPDYYPLSLNALTNACNQKSSRDPVSSYDESTVEAAADGLDQRGLLNQSNTLSVQWTARVVPFRAVEDASNFKSFYYGQWKPWLPLTAALANIQMICLKFRRNFLFLTQLIKQCSHVNYSLLFWRR